MYSFITLLHILQIIFALSNKISNKNVYYLINNQMFLLTKNLYYKY